MRCSGAQRLHRAKVAIFLDDPLQPAVDERDLGVNHPLLLLGESSVPSLGVLVYSGLFWVAERIQLEIWPEIDTLYPSNGHNLLLLRAYTLKPKVLHPKPYTLNPKTAQGSHWTLN